MGLPLLLLLLLLLVLSANALGTVAELDDSSFAAAIASSRYILVDFYAPWCGHCKVLAPELDKAAAAFPDPAVAFAKVNADRFGGIASKYKIDAYPTLKLFVDGVPTDYTGSLKAELMVPLVKRMIAPDIAYVHSVSELAQFVSQSGHDLPVFIAFLTGEEDPHLSEISKTYKLRAWFAAIPAQAVSQDLLTSYGVTAAPALLVQRSDTRNVFQGSGGKDMTEFVKRNLLPPVTHLSRDNLELVKQDGRAIALSIWNGGTEPPAGLLEQLTTLAQAHTEFVFASSNVSIWPELRDMFDRVQGKSSSLLIWTGGAEYYMMNEELQQEDVTGYASKLLEEFKEGRATKHLIKGPSFKEQLMGFIGQNLVYFFLFIISVVMFLQSMDWKQPPAARE